MEEPKKYEVQGKLDVVEFTGWLIGESSTETPESLRWIEISIYKTLGGKYIVQRRGRSLVYHYLNCAKASGVFVKGSDLDDDASPCPICEPLEPEEEGFDETIEYRRETTFYSAVVADEPKGVRDTLTLPRSSHLSAVAKEALLRAAEIDPGFGSIINQRITVE